MIIFSIDPGPSKSGSVLFDTKEQKVLWCANDIDNTDVREYIMDRDKYHDPSVYHPIPDVKFDIVAIETIEPMGLTLGNSTINTAIWVGRYYELVTYLYGDSSAMLISRGDEKIMLCGCKTFIDPQTGKRQGVKNKQVRQAIIDRFPPTGGGKTPQVGTKKLPGPLYGVSTHAWSAVAIALTCEEQLKSR